MKEKILEQISKELKLATWVDLLTLVIGVGITLIFFGVAAGAAGSTGESVSGGLGGGLGGILGAPTVKAAFRVVPTIIMFVALALIFIINWFGVKMLMKNRAQRAKLNEGMMKLFKDEAMDQYHDGSILKTYEARYAFFTWIMGAVAAVSIIIPLVIFIDQMIKL